MSLELIEKIRTALNGKRTTRDNILICCPVHGENNPSCTIGPGNGKADLLVGKCFSAGCESKEIIRALRDKGLVPPVETAKKHNKSKNGKYNVTATHPIVGEFTASGFSDPDTMFNCAYIYHDEHGKIVGFKARYVPKTFRWFGYEDGKVLKGRIKIVPYKLPELLQALKQKKTIHILEGEKDADNLAKFNVITTTFGSSSDTIPLEYLKKFEGARIVIWADNDDPGVKRAEQQALIFYRAGCEIKIAYVPDGYKDFSEWMFSRELARENIAKLLSETNKWLPAVEQKKVAEDSGITPNTHYDVGSEAYAEEFVAHLFSDKIRYVSEWKQWAAFDGKIWSQDDEGKQRQLVKQLTLNINQAINQNALSGDYAKQLQKIGARVQTYSGVRAITGMMTSNPKLVISASQFDAKDTAHLISCNDGVIDLRTGELAPHSHSYLITKHVPYSYNPGKEPTKFVHFIESCFRDRRVSEWLFNYLGYCITGETGFQKFCMLIGMPGTGKTTLQNLMRRLLNEHCGVMDADSFVSSRQRSPGIESDIASTKGKRLVFISELNSLHQLDERLLKSYAGGDPIKAKLMGQNKVEFPPTAKLLFTANYRPCLSDDDAIARRLIEVQFNHKPLTLIEQYEEVMLKEEAPEILGFLVERARRYYADSHVLDLPDQIKEWTADFIAETNIIGQWIDLFIEYRKHAPFISTDTLFTHFDNWRKERGIKEEYGRKKFANKMAIMGGVSARELNIRGWLNIAFKTSGTGWG